MTITQLIEKAREGRASDIHLVCGLTPRCRVDGSIRELGGERLTPEQSLDYVRELAGEQYDAMVEVGEADLAKTIAGVRCRLNLFRQQGSWSAAIRLLNEHVPELSELGLPKVVREFPGYSQGLVLITGETGSGKSTTLAAVLNEINQTQSKHILTLEDPVEYHIDGACQVQINEKTGLTFASVLRSVLRQDPDIIAVGEIRDGETAEIAMRAAMTGHLVLSTVHTNNAVSSIDRLLDIGVEPYLIAGAVKGIVSQRLLRKVCPHCKKPYAPSAEVTTKECGAYVMKDLDFDDDSITESVYVIAGGTQTITVSDGQYLELFATTATPAGAATPDAPEPQN